MHDSRSTAGPRISSRSHWREPIAKALPGIGRVRMSLGLSVGGPKVGHAAHLLSREVKMWGRESRTEIVLDEQSWPFVLRPSAGSPFFFPLPSTAEPSAMRNTTDSSPKRRWSAEELSPSHVPWEGFASSDRSPRRAQAAVLLRCSTVALLAGRQASKDMGVSACCGSPRICDQRQRQQRRYVATRAWGA